MSEIKFQPTQEMAKAQANELVAVLHECTSTIVALGDVLGSVNADELDDTTLTQLASLVKRAALDARELTDELWRRLRTAKVQLGVYPDLSEIADRVTGSAGDRRDENDADKFADGEHCRDEV